MNSPLFDGIAPETQERMLVFFTTKTFPFDTVIMTAGEPGDEMYIIKDGQAVVKVDGSVVHKFESGAVIGEVCLGKKNRKRTATIVVASTKLETLVINKEKFDELRAAFPVLISQVIWNMFCMVGDKLGFANEEIAHRQKNIRVSRAKNMKTTRELNQRSWLQRLAATLSFDRSG